LVFTILANSKFQMTLHLKLLSQLRKCFNEDTVSIFYHGDFDDSITDKMISLVSLESEKKIRGNLAFTIVESFQNVIRHKNADLKDENVFGMRGRAEYMHVYSSNLLTTKAQENLLQRLTDINDMSDENLKNAFLNILESGELSDRGGAGMGLVEMKRRSGNDLQFEFSQMSNNVHAFNLQVDFNRSREVKPTTENLFIEENSIVNELMIDNELLFIYKGQFNEPILKYLMPTVENSSKAGNAIFQKLNKSVVGLIQNIQCYGVTSPDGKNYGLFALKRIPGGFYVCSGNYTTEDVSSLEQMINDLNESSHEELEQIHKRISSKDVNKDDRIGLLDIRRTCADEIELKYNQDARGTYTMIGAVITEDSSK
jgi:Family of unknown function (DUF6272)